MSKLAIQNRLRYIIAREQYMKPLLKNEIISEEVYNEVLENLYDELEVWKYNRIQNPGIEFRKKKREIKSTLAEQNPGYVSLTELARNKSQKSTGYTIQMWLRDSGTVDFLTLWEKKHNEKFLPVSIELKSLTPKMWIYKTNSIGIVSRQENSLETQKEHYKNEIERNPNWTLVDVFVDFGVSGLNDTKRTEFMRMIEMCEKGKIDLILTKSISRFARNQLDCLTYIRKLKLKNIGIRFDKEGINTLEPSSEIFLSWFSAFAQAESESLSMNITRGKRMRYKEGKFPFPFSLYGYKRGENGQPEIVPEKAAIVRKMFYMYLEGNSLNDIRKWLEENEIESPMGKDEWTVNSVCGILKNEKYKGDALLQKTYTVDYLTKTVAKNKGQVAQYYVENSHQGIVSREIFDMVQDEIKRRRSHTRHKTTSYSSQYALTGIVYCGECGANYRRVTWSKRGTKTIVWRCIERLENGTRDCKHSPTIYEDKLKDAILSGLSQISLDVSDVSGMVKREIGAVIHKNDKQNEYAIKSKIKKLEKEILMLAHIVNDADDSQVYLYKIKECENELTKLNSKLVKSAKCEMNEIEDFINGNRVNMLDYFDAVVRKNKKCLKKSMKKRL